MIGINYQYLVLGIRSTGSFRVKALHILPPQHVDKLVQRPRLGCPNLIVWSHLGDTKVTVIFFLAPGEKHKGTSWHLNQWNLLKRASICIHIYIYKYVPRTHVTSFLGGLTFHTSSKIWVIWVLGIFLTCYIAIPLHPIWSKHVGVKTSAEKQSNDVKK